MKTVGIICEYNPLHLGHSAQMRLVRDRCGDDAAIVCCMSGNFVQRGEPAVFDKFVRAAAAARCGADLVVELPVTGALSSAESFAKAGVETLTRLGVCDTLAFGSETEGRHPFAAAKAMQDADFSDRLREKLATGIPYGAAKQAVLAEKTGISDLLTQPNDILAAEYCAALLKSQSPLVPLALPRDGDDRSTALASFLPSAAAVRTAMARGEDWLACIPKNARVLLRDAPQHTLAAGEKAVLARLYAMTDADWARAAHCSEGLDRKLKKALSAGGGIKQVLAAVKSRRYPATRLSRLVICAALGITADDLLSEPPYVRILAFGKRGRALVRLAAKNGAVLLNPTENAPSGEYSALEKRTDAFYRLFIQSNETEMECP